MRILHVSDLHFGSSGGESRHFFKSADGSPNPTKLAEILIKDPECSTSPDVIVASGDIGWSGVVADYDLALQFFKRLRAAWPNAILVIAAGNHDVDQGAAAGANPQAAFLALLKEVYGDGFASLYPLVEVKEVGFERESLVSVTKTADDILIVAVNTAAFLTGKNKLPVYVSRGILNRLGGHLEAIDGDGSLFRILVMHHHLLPFAEHLWGASADLDQPPAQADPTIVANSGHLQSWLAANRFSMALHGHKHAAHGRRDFLRRPQDAGRARDLLLIGAGSAGVYREEIAADEPLGYNVLVLQRLSKSRFIVDVKVRKIDPSEFVAPSREYDSYKIEVGSPPPTAPVLFSAERMDHCHAAIADMYRKGEVVLNFLSIVEDAEYHHPQTTSIRGTPASIDQVQEAFRNLHPERDEKYKWYDPVLVREALGKLRSGFRFKHGPRLFGIPGRDHLLAEGHGPIQHAVQMLGRHESHAYVGLYNAEIDVLTDGEPIPALVGLQFLVDGGRWLDAVATFRNLELSFWWVVNMFEVIELMRWAADQDTRKLQPRRITFFSPLAMWRDDPEPVFVALLDSISLSELLSLVLAWADGHIGAKERLSAMLENKGQLTSDASIDPSGLRQLTEAMVGIMKASASKEARLSPVQAILEVACEALETALDNPNVRRPMVEEARRKLVQAKEALEKS